MPELVDARSAYTACAWVAVAACRRNSPGAPRACLSARGEPLSRSLERALARLFVHLAHVAEWLLLMSYKNLTTVIFAVTAISTQSD